MELDMEKLIKFKAIMAPLAILLVFLSVSCGDDAFLYEDGLTQGGSGAVQSGDIIVVSGGNTASTTSPFPLHKIALFSSDGEMKQFLAESTGGSYYFGADFSADGSSLYYTVDNSDRVDSVDLLSLSSSTYLLDANLTGNSVRSMATLSDGSIVVAESTTSIEKYDSSKTRVTTNFPITVTASITSIKTISSGRFVVLFSGGTDNPRIYNNAGTLQGTISGLSCGANCDVYDIAELSDGRFVVSVQNATYQSLELFNSSFTHVGQLYKDATVLYNPGPLAELANGNIIACSLAFNTCEELAVSGNTASRVGSVPLISNVAAVRQPTKVLVVP